MQVGTKVKIEGDETIYVVVGMMKDRTAWLTVEDDEYEGYDADLIVSGTGRVILADGRGRYHTDMGLKICPV